jgi:hypothetical protein
MPSFIKINFEVSGTVEGSGCPAVFLSRDARHPLRLVLRLRGLRTAGAAEQGKEHRVGAVAVRPQLHMRAVTEIGYAFDVRPGVDLRNVVTCGQHVVNDHPGFAEVWRAGHVRDQPSGARGTYRGMQEPAL